MNHVQKKRLLGIVCIMTLFAIALGLILFALKQNINLFMTPTQLLQTNLEPNQSVRLGGYVKQHSVQFDPSGQHVNFVVTDRTHDILVSYAGILPNLFREGQTVVVTGKFNRKTLFIASNVLAKHDEKYRPKSESSFIPVLKREN